MKYIKKFKLIKKFSTWIHRSVNRLTSKRLTKTKVAFNSIVVVCINFLYKKYTATLEQ